MRYQITAQYGAIVLDYSKDIPGQDPPCMQITQRVSFITAPCHFGGVRYFFHCGLTVSGRYCGRRVAKLYLPSGGKYFGCRHCYDLSYESRQKYLGPFYWGVVKYFDLLEQGKPDWDRLTDKQRKKLEKLYMKVNKHSHVLDSLLKRVDKNNEEDKI